MSSICSFGNSAIPLCFFGIGGSLFDTGLTPTSPHLTARWNALDTTPAMLRTLFAERGRWVLCPRVWPPFWRSRFPRDETAYRGGLISLLRKTRQIGAALSVADRTALVESASLEASIIAKRSPKQLYQLQRDFELAGLNELIKRFEVDLEAGYKESHWQALLKLNPFILSMLFGYPIVVVRDQAHLGGVRLDGSGETIVDFLVTNESTQGVALVEIKRPDTPLTGGEFRAGRSKPSADLNSAVIQVIDQRYELLVNYKDRAQHVGKVHAVDCVVVAGRTPVDPAHLASFEMYRTSLKDVRILTFDEVLLKLRALRDYLAPVAGNRPAAKDSSESCF
jgi:hypothetical protein